MKGRPATEKKTRYRGEMRKSLSDAGTVAPRGARLRKKLESREREGKARVRGGDCNHGGARLGPSAKA